MHPIDEVWHKCLKTSQFVEKITKGKKAKRKKSQAVTPTWFEHAAFRSGVGRATVAPRSLWLLSYVLKEAWLKRLLNNRAFQIMIVNNDSSDEVIRL